MLLTIILVGTLYSAGAPPQLSVEQTIALCLTSPREGGDRQYLKLGNPSARSVVRRLTRSKYPLVSHRALRLLGYIGDHDDVAFLHERIKLEGSAEMPDKHVFTQSEFALATLARRGVPKSDEVLRMLATPGTWDGPEFAKARKALAGNSYFANHTWLSAERAIAEVVKPTDFQAFVLKNHATITNQELRQYADREVNSKSLEGILKHIDELESVETDPRWLRQLDEIFDNAIPELREEGKFPERLTSAPKLEAENKGKQLTDLEKRRFAEEAAANYADITKQIMISQSAKIVERVSEPSHLLTPKELKEHRDELVKSLNVDGALILKRIDKLGLKKGNVNVEFVRMKTPTGTSDENVVRVRWRLEGPEGFMKTGVRGLALSPSDISDDGKALVVTMFRFGGRWYWKPFGW